MQLQMVLVSNSRLSGENDALTTEIPEHHALQTKRPYIVLCVVTPLAQAAL